MELESQCRTWGFRSSPKGNAGVQVKGIGTWKESVRQRDGASRVQMRALGYRRERRWGCAGRPGPTISEEPLSS